jgi:hypothetical protein
MALTTRVFKMKRFSRRVWLGAFLAGSLALVLFDQQPGVVPEAAQASAKVAPSVSTIVPVRAPEQLMILVLRPRSLSANSGVDLFAVQTPVVTAPNTPTVAPAPIPAIVPPVPPPFPYSILGKKLEDGKWDVFLSRQNRTFAIRTGDVLDNTYRVDDIRPPSMTLTYLPMNLPQSIPIGVWESLP